MLNEINRGVVPLLRPLFLFVCFDNNVNFGKQQRHMNTNIQVDYKAGVQIAQDKIVITIENTTYAALNVLNQDLKKLIKPSQGNETYTQEACRLLLEKLTQELDKKLNFNI